MSDSLQSLRDLLERAEEASQTVEQLKDQQTELEGDIQRLSARKQFVEQEVAKASQQAEQDTALYESLKNTREEEIARLDAAAQDISKSIVSLTEELVTANQFREQAELENSVAIAKLDATKTEWVNEIQILQKQHDTLSESVESLHYKIANRTAELQSLDEQHGKQSIEYENDLTVTRKTIQVNQDVIDEQQKLLQNLQNDLTQAKQNIQDIIDTREQLNDREKAFAEKQKRAEKILEAREDSIVAREKELADKISLSRRRTSILDN